MSAVSPERVPKGTTFNIENLPRLLRIANVVTSTIENKIDEVFPDLDDVTKKWIGLGFSFLQVYSSIMQFVCSIAMKNITDFCFSLLEIGTSTTKLITAAKLLMEQTNPTLITLYTWAKNIHEGLTVAQLVIDEIQLQAYTQKSIITSHLSPSFLSPPSNLKESKSISSEAKKQRSSSLTNGGNNGR